MIDIACEKYDYSYACLENAAVTIIKWFGSDYELMSAQSWNFEYISQKKIPFGKRIFDGDIFQSELLERYHGIRSTLYHPDTNEAYEIIMDELNRQVPVIIGIDSYWLNWDNEYFQKKHDRIGHVIIIKGVDSKNRIFHCLDPVHYEKTQVLSFEKFEKGYTNLLIDFKQISTNIEVDYTLILKESMSNMFEKKTEKNVFEKIRLFAAHVLTDYDPEQEVIGYPSEVETDLLMRIKRIAQKRLRFTDFLLYIQKQNNKHKLDYFINKIKESSSKWDIIYSLFLKSYFLKDSKKLLEKISNRIIAIADFEEELALKIQNMLISGLKYKIEKEYAPIEAKQALHYKSLDLTKYYNNHGISDNINSKANLTIYDGQIFLLADHSLLKKDFSYNNIPFKISRCPNKKDNRFDNISCDNTLIIEHPRLVNKIFFLGFSEYGHYQDDCIIGYEDGTVVKKMLSFTDWDSDPQFGEQIVWTGSGVKDGKKFDEDVFIFMQTIQTKADKKLISLQLPEVPTMHVLAITFGY